LCRDFHRARWRGPLHHPSLWSRHRPGMCDHQGLCEGQRMSAATLQSLDLSVLLARFDAKKGTIEGAHRTERRLSDLAGIFQDKGAYAAACAAGNPLVYSVEAV